SGARKIVDILSQVALIDGVLDEKEKAYVDKFANAWGITLSWDALLKARKPGDKLSFVKLRRDVSELLATTPPRHQVLQLADVVNKLVNIDEQVSSEEELILEELNGMF